MIEKKVVVICKCFYGAAQKCVEKLKENTMPRDTLTGSRIRERRISLNMKQAHLAEAAGISAAYLNLIEHNRRGIGGKLLLRIAQALNTEVSLLAEGAGATLIAGLREAASAMPQIPADLDRIDEFAGRFPGWAQLLVEQRVRIAALERSVETLSDRMTHDPQLAASLHEMLSTVTAIRSTASILAESGEIEREWRDRFHRNIHEDSGRLADTSRALVTYLEATGEQATGTGVPQEEADAAIAAAGHHVPALEAGANVAEVAAQMTQGLSAAAAALLTGWLRRYAADARALPQARIAEALGWHGVDLAALTRDLGADPARIMRRLAAMPPAVLPEPVGLAICDSSGVLTYRKPLEGFGIPRFGAGCPLWPLYRALSRPLALLSVPVAQPGREGDVFRADAVAMPVGLPEVNRDPVLEAHMLVRPEKKGQGGEPVQSALEVGVTCRICPRASCPARREPSIVASP
jgi:predicted transcriptional regulator/DNA-binding XRE family transcriptional regulator